MSFTTDTEISGQMRHATVGAAVYDFLIAQHPLTRRVFTVWHDHIRQTAGAGYRHGGTNERPLPSGGARRHSQLPSVPNPVEASGPQPPARPARRPPPQRRRLRVIDRGRPAGDAPTHDRLLPAVRIPAEQRKEADLRLKRTHGAGAVEIQKTARLQDPGDLQQGGVQIGHMLQNTERQYHIETPIFKGKRFATALPDVQSRVMLSG